MTNENKIKRNITKRTATTIIVALVIGLVLLSPTTIIPNVHAQQPTMPANAIRTPNGEWVTPLQTHDKKGNLLTIHYEVGKNITGHYAIPCPTNSGISQEGGKWTNSTTDTLAIGFETTWTMPTGSVTTNSGQNGFYYNPVNFYYNGPTSGSTPFNFFQVDWGIDGTSLSPSIYQGWQYTLFYNGNPVQQTMPAVPTSQGSTYTIFGAVEPSNLANPPAYVVQVTLGSQSWLYSYGLGYNPSIDGIDRWQAFQDEYTTLSPGATNLSQDTVANPTSVDDNNGNVGYDPFIFNGMTSFTGVGSGPTTYQVLNNVQNQVTETDPVQCGTW